MKRILLGHSALTSSLLFAFAAGPAQGADVPRPLILPVSLPAVSGVNGKLDVAGGWLAPAFSPTGGVVRAEGAISFPLSHSYGLQVDGALASIQSQTFSHIAAHLFWRDPSRGLIGGYASYSSWAGLNRGRIAFEGEAYWGRVSVETRTGWEQVSGSSSLFTITDVAFYPSENLRLSAGFRYNISGSAIAGGLEHQFTSGPSFGLAGFIEGEAGSNSYSKLLGGLRLYLGADKSLVRRHREDDPRINADEGALANCGFGAVVSDSSFSLADGILSTCDGQGIYKGVN